MKALFFFSMLCHELKHLAPWGIDKVPSTFFPKRSILRGVCQPERARRSSSAELQPSGHNWERFKKEEPTSSQLILPGSGCLPVPAFQFSVAPSFYL